MDPWDDHLGDVSGLHAMFRGRRIDAGFCFIADADGLCVTPADGSKPHRVYINPLLLTREAGFRAGDILDIAYHELAHLWEPHHGEMFCIVEGKLRQSVRRWLSEREVLARIGRGR